MVVVRYVNLVAPRRSGSGGGAHTACMQHRIRHCDDHQRAAGLLESG